jgi:hypothetical protein
VNIWCLDLSCSVLRARSVDWEGMIRGWILGELVDHRMRDRESGLDAGDNEWELLSPRLRYKVCRYSLASMFEET